MVQPLLDMHLFHLGHPAYVKIRRLGLLLLGAFLLLAFIALIISFRLLPTYSHAFTLYIKWQDTLVALLWFVAFITLAGCAPILRFLYALHAGYTCYTIRFNSDNSLTVRDLSSENLLSILWIINNAFWCFVVVLIGLVPAMLIGLVLHLSPLTLAVVATFITIVVGIAGVVLSVTTTTLIVIGCLGIIPFTGDLGTRRTYQYTDNATLHIDNFVLTIISPGLPESMLDLKLLDPGDRLLLLSLLRERWADAQRLWNLPSDGGIEDRVGGMEPGVLLEPIGH